MSYQVNLIINDKQKKLKNVSNILLDPNLTDFQKEQILEKIEQKKFLQEQGVY